MLTRVAMLASISGCSFLMMNNPPSPPAKPEPRCESAVVVPVLDVVGAVATVAIGALLVRELLAEDAPPTTELAVGGLSLGLGSVFTASSVIGFRRARRCERAIEAWKATANQPTSVR